MRTNNVFNAFWSHMLWVRLEFAVAKQILELQWIYCPSDSRRKKNSIFPFNAHEKLLTFLDKQQGNIWTEKCNR